MSDGAPDAEFEYGHDDDDAEASRIDVPDVPDAAVEKDQASQDAPDQSTHDDPEFGPDCKGNPSCQCEEADCQVQIVPPILNSRLANKDSAVAALPAGGFVVAWVGLKPLGLKRAVCAICFGPPGSGPGPIINLGDSDIPDDLDTTVAALPDGRFSVAWQVSRPGETLAYVQAFGLDQTPAGPPDLAATGHAAPPLMPVIRAWAPDGYLFVVRTPAMIAASRLDPSGVVAWGPKPVTESSSISHVSAILADGRALVSWKAPGDMGETTWARFLRGDGTLDGSEFPLVGISVPNPRLAPLSDGGLLAAWVVGGNQDGDGTGILARRFDSVGAPLGEKVQVNSFFMGQQDYAAAGAFSNGSAVVAWQSQESYEAHPAGIWGQKYAADGSKAGGETLLSFVPPADGSQVHLAALPGDGYVVVWEAKGAVYATRFGPDGTALKP
jgi:hypothetical protein